ncbi:bacterioferritin [Brevundimonas sp. AJA228-03]|uniref:bacterioferritin n=1 Tax=Brevundimonas sp. AJA228-03 TaxID=2752515 RepID=UPI001ADFA1A7|nr:bacterioferritin [Brevundimonas sp. AJA228-03]QTN19039.1 bacterioferritin [Brevundimonas sp. AJA228-03]
MKGDPAIIRSLNAVLTNELTAVNQYFLHARMFESWGLKHMGQIIYDESIGEMKHADKLIKRILFLDGLPNMQDLHKLKIGENAVECLGADLQLELGGRDTLLAAVAQAEQLSDYVSRQIFMEILSDTEEHIDFLEAQFKLIEQLGEQNYLQSAMSEIAPDKAATGG